MSDTMTTETAFSSLPLHPSIATAIEDCGFTHCTPIQEKALPRALAGHDLFGLAQTGTGKTAAFLIALLNYLMINPVHPKAKGPFAVVIAPTRELVLQIKKDLDGLNRYTGLNSVVVYGGVSIEPQKRFFAELPIDIVIATPGRLIDLLKQDCFKLNAIEVVVLDEADRMFDMGFISDVRYIMRKMPPANERLNLLFSATMSQKVQELAYEHFNTPEIVNVESDQPTADNVEQILFHVSKHEKTPLLIGLLQKYKPERTLVFANTKRDVERLALVIETNGFQAAALSGDIAQKKREQILNLFKNGEIQVLIATDVAARGLHIPNIDYVFNYDLPQIAEDYVHRIGRTARAGASGVAISFACEEYVYSLPDIEHYIEQRIPVETLSDDMLADVIPVSEEDLQALRKRRERKLNHRRTPRAGRNKTRRPPRQQNYNKNFNN